MPYKRFPCTDRARLKTLKTVLDCDGLYTVGHRFIDWSLMSRVRRVYEQLFTAVSQYNITYRAQTRNSGRLTPLQNKATLYVSHFIQVLLMSVERGEIKRHALALYGLDEDATAVPNLKSINGLLDYGQKAVSGEKARLKAGGRPIYNPSAGMVSTHLDIFRETYEQQKRLQENTLRAQQAVQKLRPEADAVIQELWQQIEEHYSSLPMAERVEQEQRLGVIYYYRKNEQKPSIADKPTKAL